MWAEMKLSFSGLFASGNASLITRLVEYHDAHIMIFQIHGVLAFCHLCCTVSKYTQLRKASLSHIWICIPIFFKSGFLSFSLSPLLAHMYFSCQPMDMESFCCTFVSYF
jgi:hypothetical protein